MGQAVGSGELTQLPPEGRPRTWKPALRLGNPDLETAGSTWKPRLGNRGSATWKLFGPTWKPALRKLEAGAYGPIASRLQAVQRANWRHGHGWAPYLVAAGRHNSISFGSLGFLHWAHILSWAPYLRSNWRHSHGWVPCLRASWATQLCFHTSHISMAT